MVVLWFLGGWASISVNEQVRLIVSPADDTRAFKIKEDGTWLQVYNGLTVGLIGTLALIASHLTILTVTVRFFIVLHTVLWAKLTKRLI
jgi:hypothetical protein